VEEPGAKPVVGTLDDALIAEGTDVMVYGDGGAAKTTLVIDLACHLAAGDDWHGVAIPQTRRVGLIENEGPRPLLRRKVQRKLAGWEASGSPIEGRVVMADEPWLQVDLADETIRQELAEAIAALELDLVVIGPLAASGMYEAGTLADVRAFLRWLADVRRQAGRPVTFILVHHESKSGKVSGAWEAAGDTLLHVQSPTKGHTQLDVQKARWSSTHHGAKIALAWTPGEGFAVEEVTEVTDEDAAEHLIEFITAHAGTNWKPVEKAIEGVGNDRLVTIRDRLLRQGVIVNVTNIDRRQRITDEVEQGKRASLYVADDPAIRQLARDSGPVPGQSGPPGGDPGDQATGPRPAPIRAAGPGPVQSPLDLDPLDHLRDVLGERVANGRMSQAAAEEMWHRGQGLIGTPQLGLLVGALERSA
jgi:hypothetical protein